MLNLLGKRFGRLSVIKQHTKKTKSGGYQWCCKCDCGHIIIVNSSNLVRGHTQSCKCLQSDNARDNHYTHRKSKTKTYTIWNSMIQRCTNTKHKSYRNYGAAGIEVCARWKLFENFFVDMGECPESHSIDRINNGGNYEPSNCRWANSITQANNKKTNRLVTFNGRKQTISEWAREYNISYSLFRERLNRGWDIEKSLTSPKIINQFGGLQ